MERQAGSARRRLQKLWPGNEGSHRYVVLSRLELGDFAGAAAEARAGLARPGPHPPMRRISAEPGGAGEVRGDRRYRR